MKKLKCHCGLVEAEINLDEAIEENEKPKKKGFFKKLKDKFNNLEH